MMNAFIVVFSVIALVFLCVGSVVLFIVHMNTKNNTKKEIDTVLTDKQAEYLYLSLLNMKDKLQVEEKGSYGNKFMFYLKGNNSDYREFPFTGGYIKDTCLVYTFEHFFSEFKPSKTYMLPFKYGSKIKSLAIDIKLEQNKNFQDEKNKKAEETIVDLYTKSID